MVASFLFFLSCSSRWAAQDHREHTLHHAQYPFPLKRSLSPSLDGRTVSHNNYCLTYTISPWKTPAGPRHFIVSSLSSFGPRTLPSVSFRTQQSFMGCNEVQPQLTCHLSSCPWENSCALSSQWNSDNKGERISNRFLHLWPQRGHCFPSYHAENLCRGCFSELISTTKMSSENTALFYKG